MKYRIEIITLKNGNKKYKPQYKKLFSWCDFITILRNEDGLYLRPYHFMSYEYDTYEEAEEFINIRDGYKVDTIEYKPVKN